MTAVWERVEMEEDVVGVKAKKGKTFPLNSKENPFNSDRNFYSDQFNSSKLLDVSGMNKHTCSEAF